jgi:hypothetical protein
MVYKADPSGNKGSLMLHKVSGRRPAFKAVSRAGLLSFGLILSAGLSACTTTEGTNAFSDVGTFEREVAIDTMQGMGMMDREKKDENIQPRGPLVLPKDASLPPPVDEKTNTAETLLPTDTNNAQIDTKGLTQEDLNRLRNARVVDLRTMNGRPLTDVEVKQLTGRFAQARLKGGARPLYLPPEEYFTTVKGQDMVCLAANGELVPLSDKSCPPEIRKALAAQAN